MYIYAETAFHHQGESKYLETLILNLSNTKCNGIKFQVLTSASDFISEKHSAYTDLASYCLNKQEWQTILDLCLKNNIDVILMPLNLDAIELAAHKAVAYLDIHSVSINDLDLLAGVKATQKPVILGIGGRTISEIQQLLVYFSNQIHCLMTGFQSFPSKLEHIGLNRIKELKALFPNLEIGYADHSAFDAEHAIISNDYAAILGATIFEKHVTLVEGDSRVDAASAVSIPKLETIIERLEFIEKHVLPKALMIEMNQAETTYRNRQAAVVSSSSFSKGQKLEASHLSLKLVDIPNDFNQKEKLIGQTLLKDILKDEPFMQSHIQTK